MLTSTFAAQRRARRRLACRGGPSPFSVEPGELSASTRCGELGGLLPEHLTSIGGAGRQVWLRFVGWNVERPKYQAFRGRCTQRTRPSRSQKWQRPAGSCTSTDGRILTRLSSWILQRGAPGLPRLRSMSWSPPQGQFRIAHFGGDPTRTTERRGRGSGISLRVATCSTPLRRGERENRDRRHRSMRPVVIASR